MSSQAKMHWDVLKLFTIIAKLVKARGSPIVLFAAGDSHPVERWHPCAGDGHPFDRAGEDQLPGCSHHQLPTARQWAALLPPRPRLGQSRRIRLPKGNAFDAGQCCRLWMMRCAFCFHLNIMHHNIITTILLSMKNTLLSIESSLLMYYQWNHSLLSNEFSQIIVYAISKEEPVCCL